MRKAVCILRPDGNSGVSGIVEFVEKEDHVSITAEVTGLSRGLHGFHIHEFGDLREGCISAGAHYNPSNKTHAGPTDKIRHIGDLGNINSESGKFSKFKLKDKLVKLSGEFSIIGRSMVVHADEDDLGRGGDEESLKTGNAGARLACGVIALAN